MIDHVSIRVKDFARSRAFYTAALAPLGYTAMMEFPTDAGPVAGLGAEGKPDFWLSAGAPGAPLHLAFLARERAMVDAFHRAALAAGARDNGAPGPRPQYHPNYYGAFVFDPDGNNVEVVCHAPA